MNHFIGWLNNPHSEEDYSRLADSVKPNSNCNTIRQHLDHKDAFITVVNETNSISTSKQNSLIFLVNGFVQWSDEKLEKIALEADLATTLVQGFNLYGHDVVKHAHGNFTFVIYDTKNSKVILSTDRIGSSTINYCMMDNTFFFSNNLDLLKNCTLFNSSISNQSIYHYLYFHVIPSPRTIYKNVNKMNAASQVIFNQHSITEKIYWEPKFDSSDYQFESVRNQLFTKLNTSIDNCIDSDRTATFLSGGLDSSTVSGIFAKRHKDNPTSFSIGFSEEGYDELDYARITASHFELNLKEYCVTPQDVFNTIPIIVEYFDEPFGNSSAVPTYQCAIFAKNNGFNSLLAGDGGDELFAGNERYAKQKIFEHYYNIPNAMRKMLLEPIFLKGLSNTNIKPLYKARRYIEQALIPLPKRMLAHNFFNITPTHEILSPGFHETIDFNTPLNEMIHVYDACNSENFIDKLLMLDWKFTLADNDLRKVGIMCGAADVSVRYPLLDDSILDLSCGIPVGEKLKGFKLRYFYKQAMKGFLSDKTLNKPKQGFGLPFGIWLRTDAALKEIARDSLSDFAKRKIINSDYLQKLQGLHEQEHAAFYGEFIWLIIILEQWLQKRNL